MTRLYTPTELDELKLPGLPGKRAIQIRAKKEGWQGVKKGNAVAYPLSVLPAEAQDEMRKRAISSRSKELVASAAATAVAKMDPTSFKTYQRDTLQARAVFLAHIDSLIVDGYSRSRAINTVVDMAKKRELPPELAELLPVANARAGGTRTLSPGTLHNWWNDRAEGGVNALAPAAPAEDPIPEWAGMLMDLYARPTKPSLAWAVKELAKKLRADLVPSYDQARRFLLRLDTITRNQGRMGPRALKSLRAYVARDTSELWPGAVYVSDGHCFDAEVQHPRHGRPFRPEMVVVVDVYTRRVVGWALGLAENKWDVTAAATKAFTTSTVCDIWYADNGPGYNNRMWDDALTRLEVAERVEVAATWVDTGVMGLVITVTKATAVVEHFAYLWAANDNLAYVWKDAA